MNNVILIGNLTRDPECRYTPDTQMAICTFTLAISKGKDKGADFPRVTVFAKQAENCERFLAKGRKVAVQGKIATNSYKNKEGVTVYTTDVIANNVEFLDKGDRAEQDPGVSDLSIPEGFQALDEEIPF